VYLTIKNNVGRWTIRPFSTKKISTFSQYLKLVRNIPTRVIDLYPAAPNLKADYKHEAILSGNLRQRPTVRTIISDYKGDP